MAGRRRVPCIISYAGVSNDETFLKTTPIVFQYNITVIKIEPFSFAVSSTAKEIIFNPAAFASQAKRAVKQYKKIRHRTYELEHLVGATL
jgi:hypothetical protein